IGGILAIKDGFDARAKHPIIGLLLIGLGFSSIIAACALLIVGTAGIGVIIGLIVAVIMTVVYWANSTLIRNA
ncbi:hypothetical protein, partial [Xanthomonas oryzae]